MATTISIRKDYPIVQTEDTFTNPIEAYHFFIKAEALALSALDDFQIAIARISLTKVLMENGAYKEALDKNLQALQYFAKSGNLDKEAQCWKNMALIYGNLGDRIKQLEYNKKCLDITRSLNEPIETIKILNNIGHAYFELGKLEKAEVIFKTNLESLHLTPDLKAVSYKNLTKVYLKQEDYVRARLAYKETVSYIKKHQLNKYLVACDYIFGSILFEEGNFKEAVNYLKKAVDTLDEKGIQRKELMVTLEVYLKCLTEIKDQQNLKIYLKKYIALNNKLNAEFSNQTTKNLQFQFELNEIAKEHTFLVTQNEALQVANKKVAAQKIALEAKSIQLESVNQELREFAYRIAHDLKQPVRTINSFTHLLEKGLKTQLSKSTLEYMQFITTSAKDMSKFIDDILIYAKSDQSDQKLVMVDTMVILDKIKHRLAAQIKDDKVQLNYINLPKIQGHTSLILQVFQNIISNAIKFKRPEIDPIIKVDCTETTTHYTFKIEDNGIGIQKKDQKKIFQLFTRVHRKDTYEGTGIGLSTVQKILRRYHASIDVTSVYGEGTIFNIVFPK